MTYHRCPNDAPMCPSSPRGWSGTPVVAPVPAPAPSPSASQDPESRT
ncbi:hypothetical protein [Lysobacter gummosus]